MTFFLRVWLASWLTLVPLAVVLYLDGEAGLGDVVGVAVLTAVVSVVLWTVAVLLVVLWAWALNGAA